MALTGIDIDRAVFTHSEREALVQAVFSAPQGEPEKDFIEWKSRYDLRSPEDQCKLARHILGFANRNPDKAAPVFGGSAYLICGVEPGDVQGVEKLDAADIVQGIGRYTGTAEGPRWDFDYVDQGGRDVLIITIERPSWGDPIRTLQKGFGAYVAGTVFMRRHEKDRASRSVRDTHARVALRSANAAVGVSGQLVYSSQACGGRGLDR